MSSLTELQHWLLHQLTRPVRLRTEASAVEAANRYLAPCGSLAPAEQLEVYRRQFWLRHTAALLEDYPALSRLLGQREWELLVESYLRELPRSWTLRDLGAGMAEHIRQRSSTPRQALCVDMARLEWAYVEVFDAPFSPALDPIRLQRLNANQWLEVKIQLAPTLRLLRLSYPVAELRAELRGTCPSPPRHAQAQRGWREVPGDFSPETSASPVPSTHDLVVFRDRHLRLSYRRIGELEAKLMQKLEKDPGLVSACEQLVAQTPEAEAPLEQHVGRWLANWAQSDWLANVDV